MYFKVKYPSEKLSKISFAKIYTYSKHMFLFVIVFLKVRLSIILQHSVPLITNL